MCSNIIPPKTIPITKLSTEMLKGFKNVHKQGCKTEAQIVSYGILYLTQVPTSANLHTRSILLLKVEP